ncbi:MAG: hypothetical protein ACYDHN_07050, partial [Solirubrobacteraceae bacterium]
MGDHEARLVTSWSVLIAQAKENIMRNMKPTVVGLLIAAIAFAVTASVADAARPAQPKYYHHNAAITENKSIRASFRQSRLWWWSKKLVFICEKGLVENGNVKEGGAGSGELIFKECTSAKAEEAATAPKFFEEGAGTNCTVKTTGAVAGEIKTPKLTEKLV